MTFNIQQDCSVCLAPIGEDLYFTCICKNKYHINCLQKIVKQHHESVCPRCRKEIANFITTPITNHSYIQTPQNKNVVPVLSVFNRRLLDDPSGRPKCMCAKKSIKHFLMNLIGSSEQC